jgi:hypothetical protein
MKSHQKKIDYFIIIGVMTAIIISLILYILGIETINSVFIALLGIIITLQIDIINRMEKTLHVNKQYFELGNKIESISWLYSSIFNIVHSTNIIVSKSKNSLFKDSAKYEVERCQNMLDNLKRGYLKTDYYDINPLLMALEKTKNNLRSVSVLSIDTQFWESSMGKKFWEENIRAINRNVSIERIFVYETWDDKLQKLIEKQVAAGVKVFVISQDKLPHYLCVDMIIYDNEFMYKAILNSNGIPIENLLSTNVSDINHEIKIFKKNQHFANKFENNDKHNN